MAALPQSSPVVRRREFTRPALRLVDTTGLRRTVGAVVPARPATPAAGAATSPQRVVATDPTPFTAPVARRQKRRRSAALSSLATVGLLVAVWLGAGALRGGAPHLRVLPGSQRVEGGYAYVVRPGDTLWSIATRLAPGGDPRPLVDELAAEVGSGTLAVGERLRLP